MTVEFFKTSLFRSLFDHEVRLHPNLTVLQGDNGAGKSSALEALQIACRGRSLRAQPAEQAKAGTTCWSVEARLSFKEAPPHQLKVSWKGRTTSLWNGERLAFNQYYRLQPVAMLDWSSHQLATAGPSARRGFLDWQLFHVEQHYAECWLRWRRLLAQRNKALQTGQSDRSVVAWNESLIAAAALVDAARRRAVDAVANPFRARLQQLMDFSGLNLRYQPGWEQNYAEVLQAGLAVDRRRGRTMSGPQRADWQILMDDRPLAELSRGEQKLILAALLLASASSIGETTGRVPLLLIDDFAAELSEASQSRLRELLGRYEGQVVLAVHQYQAKDWAMDHQMFHVERGLIAVAVQ